MGSSKARPLALGRHGTEVSGRGKPLPYKLDLGFGDALEGRALALPRVGYRTTPDERRSLHSPRRGDSRIARGPTQLFTGAHHA